MNRQRIILLWAAGLVVTATAWMAENSPPRPVNPALPTIFIAGDSTAASHSGTAVGWGFYFAEFFDAARINVVNRAIGGRSSRTFITEGAWDKLVAEVKAGDTVLIQFGHNDGAAINDERIARGSLPGLGEETQEIDNKMTKQHEIVRTFGWYVRKMIADIRAKGATPILLSLTVRNIWKDGKVERGSGKYGAWTRAIAEAEKAQFVDITNLAADHYEQIGQDKVKPFFPRDVVHTNDDGARLVAGITVGGLKGLRENALNRCLSSAGREVRTAPPTATWVPPQPPPRGGGPDRTEFMHWLNLPDMADAALPSLFLIGDSTVRNGRGNGYDGQFGWGDPLEDYFDPAKLNVVNRAVGGTGVRSFIAAGYWKSVLAMLKPGDIVLMQFGHNDNGPRGPLKGTGDEIEERENPQTKEKEIVHSFGWYLRNYIADARAKGATPIVCSLVPRKVWKDGKIQRNKDTHAGWAEEAAKAAGAGFIDLNELIAQRYDALGEKAVDALFADRGVHTSWEGAKLSASVVITGLEAMPKNPVAPFLRSAP